MDARHSADYKWFEAKRPSLFWQALSSVAWGAAAGAILAAFVILTMHLEHIK